MPEVLLSTNHNEHCILFVFDWWPIKVISRAGGMQIVYRTFPGSSKSSSGSATRCDLTRLEYSLARLQTSQRRFLGTWIILCSMLRARGILMNSNRTLRQTRNGITITTGSSVWPPCSVDRHRMEVDQVGTQNHNHSSGHQSQQIWQKDNHLR